MNCVSDYSEHDTHGVRLGCWYLIYFGRSVLLYLYCIPKFSIFRNVSLVVQAYICRHLVF
jgi:hypothetical protein